MPRDPNKQQCVVWLEKNVHMQLKIYAIRHEMTMAQVVEQLIIRHIELEGEGANG